jgi:hypothetical protein
MRRRRIGDDILQIERLRERPHGAQWVLKGDNIVDRSDVLANLAAMCRRGVGGRSDGRGLIVGKQHLPAMPRLPAQRPKLSAALSPKTPVFLEGTVVRACQRLSEPYPGHISVVGRRHRAAPPGSFG